MSKDKDKDPKKTLKQKLIDNAYTRKINRQYEFLKKWDSGEISGTECCEAIEQEGKIFRIENDLIEHNKGKHGRN